MSRKDTYPYESPQPNISTPGAYPSAESSLFGNTRMYSAPQTYENASPVCFIDQNSTASQAQYAPFKQCANDHYYAKSQESNAQNERMYAAGSSQLYYMPMPFPMYTQIPIPKHTQTVVQSRSVKTVELDCNGCLIVRTPVPFRVAQHNCASGGVGMEFSHLKYMAVCGDPDAFVELKYPLRAHLAGRVTEIFVVYNEDHHLFARTWKSIRKNIAYICTKDQSIVWGPDGWQKIVVCIVGDGRDKIHPKTLNTLGVLGCYQEGHIKTSINGQPVTAHTFEYTTQVTLPSDSKDKEFISGVPVQVIFCLKEKNTKKINSHRWFFNAFGKLLQPKVCILLDVGTKPQEKSFYRLWREFQLYPEVAGACGEVEIHSLIQSKKIYVETGNCLKLVNPIVAAQNFEYKMSNILDKPLESMFGFISVLPGAFSAYRYSALQNASDGKGPLQKYFLGEKLYSGNASSNCNIKQANMYLAEDRILCFELTTKRNHAYRLSYVRGARAETDVPDSIPEFISQRRRWLNGSFFASVHSITNIQQIFRTKHTLFRKSLLLVQCVYNIINLVFSWFGLANAYLVFYYLTSDISTLRSVFHLNTDFEARMLFDCASYTYIAALVLIFLAALGNRPQGSKLLYTICMLMFSLLMVFMLFTTFASIFLKFGAYRNTDYTLDWNRILADPTWIQTVLSVASTICIYVLASFLYAEPWHLITCFIQYLVLLPCFTNVLMIYAFCNLHDISWGTKGSDSVAGRPDEAPCSVEKQDDKFKITTTFPKEIGEIDALYEQYLVLAYEPDMQLIKGGPGAREDYFKAFRSRIVVFWTFTNAALALGMTFSMDSRNGSAYVPLVVVTAHDGSTTNLYLASLLWSIAGLAAFRFLGSLAYILQGVRKSRDIKC